MDHVMKRFIFQIMNMAFCDDTLHSYPFSLAELISPSVYMRVSSRDVTFPSDNH